MAETPPRYKGWFFLVKQEISRILGRKISAQPYDIANNTYKMYRDENHIRQQGALYSPTAIRKMKKAKFKKWEANFNILRSKISQRRTKCYRFWKDSLISEKIKIMKNWKSFLKIVWKHENTKNSNYNYSNIHISLVI